MVAGLIDRSNCRAASLLWRGVIPRRGTPLFVELDSIVMEGKEDMYARARARVCVCVCVCVFACMYSDNNL